jgi:hypothetical protein
VSSTTLISHTKRVCFNCGKKLTIFEEYYHPTLGRQVLLCGECFDKVWDSETRWGRFVIWNSFNPDAPDPSFIDTYPFPRETKIIHRKKIL